MILAFGSARRFRNFALFLCPSAGSGAIWGFFANETLDDRNAYLVERHVPHQLLMSNLVLPFVRLSLRVLENSARQQGTRAW